MDADRSTLPYLARAGLLTGVSALIPIPFADEWVAERARRGLVASLLAYHGRVYSAGELEPLWCEKGGSWLSLPFRVAGKLVLVPVKKALRTLFVVLAVRAVALDVGRTLQLGRVLDRLLADGLLRDEMSPDDRKTQAQRIRDAFDDTFAGSDQRALRDVVARVLKAIRRSGATTGEAVAVTLARDGELSPREEQAFRRAEEEVERVVERPELQGFFADFDRRFDEALDERRLR